APVFFVAISDGGCSWKRAWSPAGPAFLAPTPWGAPPARGTPARGWATSAPAKPANPRGGRGASGEGAAARAHAAWGGAPGGARAAGEGAAWVFHLAALPSVQRSVENPVASHEACATGTLQVLDAARRAQVRRVVYAASSSAYGATPGTVRTEDDPTAPLSP